MTAIGSGTAGIGGVFSLIFFHFIYGLHRDFFKRRLGVLLIHFGYCFIFLYSFFFPLGFRVAEFLFIILVPMYGFGSQVSLGLSETS